MDNVANRMTTAEYRELMAQDKKAKKRKMNNKPTVWHGKWRGKQVSIKFDSGAEMRAGVAAIRREQTGEIRNLQFQVPFELIPKQKDEQPVTYILDQVYHDPVMRSFKGHEFMRINVAVDVKGHPTSLYIMKRKLFKQNFPGILFLEIRDA